VPDIFEEFARLGKRTGTPCETKGLRTSWRSASAVLEVVNRAADRLARDRDHEKLCALVPARLEVGPTGLTGGYEAVSSEGSAILRSVEKLRECGFAYERISVLTYKNDSALEARNELAQGGVDCDLVTARPKDIPGLRRFIRLLAAWFGQGEMDFPIWWGLASEFCGLSHLQFDGLREHVKEQTPQENWTTLASMVGDVLEDKLLDAFRTENPKRVDRDMLDRLIDRFKVDPQIARDEVACRRLARVLGGRSELQTEPLRILGEMTRKDFAGSAADSAGAVKVSTIHQYKGLENDAVVIRYDFGVREGVDKLRLDYVARSRARRRIVAIGPPMEVAEDWRGNR
jgi:superfamily I DNA/RNA helicase